MTATPGSAPSREPRSVAARRRAAHDGAAAAALRVRDTLRGLGRAYDGERLLVEVDYSIKDVEDLGPTSALPASVAAASGAGTRTRYGVLKSPRAGVLAEHVGARLTLELSDGRVLDFTVSKVLGPNLVLIQGLGDFA